GEQQTSTKGLIDRLISKWENQYEMDLTISVLIGRMHSSLIFADDLSTFKSSIDSNRCPRALKEDIEIKVLRQFFSSYSLIIQQFHRTSKEDEWLTELQQRYVSLYKIIRMRIRDGLPLNEVRANVLSFEKVKLVVYGSGRGCDFRFR
ncbi:unnamed protein product, partial [Rotaria sp. Silwood2]